MLFWMATTGLALAVSEMHTLAGNARPEAFKAALRDAESLRTESQNVRAALERHRADHKRNPFQKPPPR
jgi:hypothetical protein